MNIEDTLAPNSDQLDAIELVAGPRTFTIDKVTRGNAEQPVNVHFLELDRPWRPSKGMRRVLAACWGAEAAAWAGRRVELYYDPTVTFGKERPGGTRIKALSHIDGTKQVPVLVSRGKSGVVTVEPLPDVVPGPTEADVNASTDTDLLRSWWKPNPHLRAAIEARVDALKRVDVVEAQGDSCENGGSKTAPGDAPTSTGSLAPHPRYRKEA
jgi:hypothetical protein